MTDYAFLELAWDLYHDLDHRVDDELHRVAYAIDLWIDTAFRRRLPADWRQQLRWVLDQEVAQGRRVTPDTCESSAQFREAPRRA
jgi:hypothetical protein